MTACPDAEELALLLDGEVTHNRGDQLREHLRACSVCGAAFESQRQLVADIRAPLPGVPSTDLVAGLLRKLDDTVGRPRRISRLVWGTAAAFASAAALVLLSMISPPRTTFNSDASFQARGAHNDRLLRRVGTTIYSVGRTTQRVEVGAHVRPDTALVLAYRNLEKTDPVYLLAFAVDAKSAIHWLYPAFPTAAQDPAALELAYADRETALPETVILDDPAAGALRFVVVVSKTLEHVSRIEQMAASDLQVSALRKHLPDAVITELPVVVAPGAEP
jgi:hypothetical protein